MSLQARFLNPLYKLLGVLSNTQTLWWKITPIEDRDAMKSPLETCITAAIAFFECREHLDDVLP